MATPRRSNETPAPGFERFTAADLMEGAVQVGHPNTKADVLASMMIEGFGGVPIVEEDRCLVGIVTEFDLLAALERGRRLGDVSAGDVMTQEPLRVSVHTDVRTIMHVLQANHLIRVPVVDQDGKLVGIVARRDVLKGYVTSRPE